MKNITSVVAEYMGRYHSQPDDGTRGNWADGIDSAIEDSGYELAGKPDGGDPSELAYVYVEGKRVSVYVSDGGRDHDDPYRYMIVSIDDCDDDE